MPQNTAAGQRHGAVLHRPDTEGRLLTPSLSSWRRGERSEGEEAQAEEVARVNRRVRELSEDSASQERCLTGSQQSKTRKTVFVSTPEVMSSTQSGRCVGVSGWQGFILTRSSRPRSGCRF